MGLTNAPIPLDVGEIARMMNASGLIRTQNLRIERADPNEQRLDIVMPFAAGLERACDSGQFHGGAVTSLIDTTACFCVAMLQREPPPTVEVRTDFLRPAMAPWIRASAEVRRLGRSLALVDVDVTDSQERLVAIGRASFLLAMRA